MDNRFGHNFESSCDNWQLVERSMRSVDPVVVGTVVIRIVGNVGIIRSAGAGLDTVIPHELCVRWNITQGVEYYCWSAVVSDNSSIGIVVLGSESAHGWLLGD